MDLIILSANQARWGDHQFSCAIGRSGQTGKKQEGDGATPIGSFLFRRILYRPDRLSMPTTALNYDPIGPNDGWCDTPDDPEYNRPVPLPYAASCENLWRDDHLYDAIVILGHNDDPPVPGLGSAIFLHIASPEFGTTEGCVALCVADLITVIAQADASSRVVVRPFAD